MSVSLNGQQVWWRTWSPLRLGLIVYLASAVATWIVLRAFADTPVIFGVPATAIAFGLSLPTALASRFAKRSTVSQVFVWAYAVLMVAALLIIWNNAYPIRPYGDGPQLVQILQSGYHFPRWLFGMAFADWLYVGFWKFPPVAARLPSAIAGISSFMALLCTLTMGISAIALLSRWPDRLSILLPLLTPVWILFASAYTEIYPLVMGVWLGALAWLFEKPFNERSPLVFGCLLGFLPVAYAGFVGLSLCAGFIYVASRPRRALVMLGAAAATMAIAIAICWPTGITNYLTTLYAEMNFGENNMYFRQYRGTVASPQSLFFSTTYVFSAEHFQDLVFMAMWGGGLWLWPVFAASIVSACRNLQRMRTELKDSRTWLGLFLTAWQLYYFVFMIPKLGPKGDVDMFCPTFLTLAFISGHVLGKVDEPGRNFSILCAATGSSLITALFLAWTGLRV